MSGNSPFDFACGATGRRQFIRTLGAAGLGLAATGSGLFGAAGPVPAVMGAAPAARLDPAAPLRIGMIGDEGHTYEIFNALPKIPGAQIAAHAFEDGDWEYNADGSPRRGGAYDLDAKRKWCAGQSWHHDKLKVYETYQEMLDKEKLDIAVVCLPYVRNAYASAAAAAHGVNVLCEKPVAVNNADLDMLEAAVKKSGVRLSALFSMRFAPTIYTLRGTVQAGSVGKVALASAQKSYKWGEERPWFYKQADIYGSTILWVAIHAIDFMRWSTGLEVKKVEAMHGNLAHPDYPGCQDYAVLNLQFEGGAAAAMTADYLRPETAPTHGDDRLRVIGSGGVVETKDLDTRVELITTAAKPVDLPLAEPPMLFADFVAELRGQGTHLIGPDEAVRVTRICIAATQSAREGKIIEV